MAEGEFIYDPAFEAGSWFPDSVESAIFVSSIEGYVAGQTEIPELDPANVTLSDRATEIAQSGIKNAYLALYFGPTTIMLASYRHLRNKLSS